LINFNVSAANFQMNLVVGRRAHFKLMKLIVNSRMKINMIVQAWHKDRLVDLVMTGGPGTTKNKKGVKKF
jgi:hypothetical protein